MDKQVSTISHLHQHLFDSFDLEEEEIHRLLGDILGFFDATIEEYIQTRHLELKAQGLKNEDIYMTIQSEMEIRRFKAPSLSIRQIRRIIYG